MGNEDDKTDAERLKDQYLELISQRLREPLTPIQASLNILLQNATPENEDELEIIRRNVALQSKLIDDILDMSRVINGHLKIKQSPMDVHSALASAIDLAKIKANERGVTLFSQMHAEQSVILGDEPRLRKTFFNIIHNAINFSHHGNQVSIETYNATNRIYVSVQDEGCGMKQCELEKVFQPFNSTKGDMGVGLAIAHGIISAHGGSITASTEGEGKGCKFDISLDLTNQKLLTKLPTGTIKKNIHVLLIEDHRDTRHVMTKLLEMMNFQVFAVSTLADAKRYFHNGQTCDLVISDIGLPDGKGHEILPFLKERNIKAIAVSGYGADFDIAVSHEHGFAYHFVKPVEMEVLRKAILTIASHHHN